MIWENSYKNIQNMKCWDITSNIHDERQDGTMTWKELMYSYTAEGFFL